MPTTLSELEDNTKALAEAASMATRAAFERTLKSGGAATIADGDAIYRVEPDGSRVKIGDLPPLQIMPDFSRLNAR